MRPNHTHLSKNIIKKMQNLNAVEPCSIVKRKKLSELKRKQKKKQLKLKRKRKKPKIKVKDNSSGGFSPGVAPLHNIVKIHKSKLKRRVFYECKLFKSDYRSYGSRIIY